MSIMDVYKRLQYLEYAINKTYCTERLAFLKSEVMHCKIVLTLIQNKGE